MAILFVYKIGLNLKIITVIIKKQRWLLNKNQLTKPTSQTIIKISDSSQQEGMSTMLHRVCCHNKPLAKRTLKVGKNVV